MSYPFIHYVKDVLLQITQTDITSMQQAQINKFLQNTFEDKYPIRNNILQHLGLGIRPTNFYILDLTQSMDKNKENIKTIIQEIKDIYKFLNISFIIIIVRDYDVTSVKPITVYIINSSYSDTHNKRQMALLGLESPKGGSTPSGGGSEAYFTALYAIAFYIQDIFKYSNSSIKTIMDFITITIVGDQCGHIHPTNYSDNNLMVNAAQPEATIEYKILNRLPQLTCYTDDNRTRTLKHFENLPQGLIDFLKILDELKKIQLLIIPTKYWENHCRGYIINFWKKFVDTSKIQQGTMTIHKVDIILIILNIFDDNRELYKYVKQYLNNIEFREILINVLGSQLSQLYSETQIRVILLMMKYYNYMGYNQYSTKIDKILKKNWNPNEINKVKAQIKSSFGQLEYSKLLPNQLFKQHFVNEFKFPFQRIDDITKIGFDLWRIQQAFEGPSIVSVPSPVCFNTVTEIKEWITYFKYILIERGLLISTRIPLYPLLDLVIMKTLFENDMYKTDIICQYICSIILTLFNNEEYHKQLIKEYVITFLFNFWNNSITIENIHINNSSLDYRTKLCIVLQFENVNNITHNDSIISFITKSIEHINNLNLLLTGCKKILEQQICIELIEPIIESNNQMASSRRRTSRRKQRGVSLRPEQKSIKKNIDEWIDFHTTILMLHPNKCHIELLNKYRSGNKNTTTMHYTPVQQNNDHEMVCSIGELLEFLKIQCDYDNIQLTATTSYDIFNIKYTTIDYKIYKLYNGMNRIFTLNVSEVDKILLDLQIEIKKLHDSFQ